MAPETLPSAFYLALDPAKPSPSSWSSLCWQSPSPGSASAGSSLPESIPVHGVALPISQHFPILGSGQPLMCCSIYLLQAPTDLGVRDHLAQAPSPQGYQYTYKKLLQEGLFPILHCQSCSNRLHILQHRTNSVI